MRAGKLRHRITIEKPTNVQDPVTGATTAGWEPVATVWASVDPLSVREFISASATQSAVSARITIRYRPDIMANMRVLHAGGVYNIEGVLADPNTGREYLTLPVSMGVNDGS